MKRHRWTDNECKDCGILRRMATEKTRIAFNNGIYQYLYKRKYLYNTNEEAETFDRPNCYRPTFD